MKKLSKGRVFALDKYAIRRYVAAVVILIIVATLAIVIPKKITSKKTDEKKTGQKTTEVSTDERFDTERKSPASVYEMNLFLYNFIDTTSKKYSVYFKEDKTSSERVYPTERMYTKMSNLSNSITDTLEENVFCNSTALIEEYENSIETNNGVSNAANTYENTYQGPVLTPMNGVVDGPSGRETYYNLDMSGVISIMNNNGYYYDYWVRSDGCKMFGDYIMCAANLDIRPIGSLVETSLGTGIVCDTGGFAYENPYQLDIATTW